MTPYIDIHTHRCPAASPEEVIRIASFRMGVDTVLPAAPFSAGIHPWDAGTACGHLSEIEERLRGCGATAVGEIGLDYARTPGQASCQRTVLATQLRLAAELRLPVILHCVKAFEPVMRMLQGDPLPAVIFHGYTGSPQQTARAIAAGYYLSAGPRSLSSPKTKESIRTLPSHRLFIETDDSDTSIQEVYAEVAALQEIPATELKEIVYQNFKTVFPAYGMA